MLVLSTYLNLVKTRLQNGEIKASDAVLNSLRVCKHMTSSDKLAVMNRELLGYSTEDVNNLAKVLKQYVAELPANGAAQAPHSVSLQGQPVHRLVDGMRVPTSIVSEQISVVPKKEVSKVLFFCDLGLIELEMMLAKVCDSFDPNIYTAIECDEQSETIFICKVESLKQLYRMIVEEVCNFIDDILGDLSAPPSTLLA